MNRLLTIIKSAVLFIAALLTNQSALKAENESLKKTIGDQAKTLDEQSKAITSLQEQHAQDELDDETLQKAADSATEAARVAEEKRVAAEARAAELDAIDEELKTEGEKLAELISNTDETPLVVDSRFNVKES